MSRKGNPYDNAVSESSFKTLKRELTHAHGQNYANHEQARMSIFRYKRKKPQSSDWGSCLFNAWQFPSLAWGDPTPVLCLLH